MRFESFSKEDLNTEVPIPHEVSDLVPYLKQRVGAKIESLDHTELQNEAFQGFVNLKLVEQLETDLEGVGFSDEEIEEALKELISMDDEEISAALSLPWELRNKKFEEYLEKIDSDEATPNSMIRELKELSLTHGFSVGYHASPFDIKPKDGRWVILGTEKDHRDNDLPMAYHSKNYQSLYRRKDPNYLYFVRSEKGHRGDGKWSRAPSLSVIQSVPMKDVTDTVSRITNELEKK